MFIKYYYHKIIKYLIIIYINHISKFVKCFVNQVLYFNTIITFRKESNYTILKKYLKLFIEDFKIMFNCIDILLRD